MEKYFCRVIRFCLPSTSSHQNTWHFTTQNDRTQLSTIPTMTSEIKLIKWTRTVLHDDDLALSQWQLLTKKHISHTTVFPHLGQNQLSQIHSHIFERSICTGINFVYMKASKRPFVPKMEKGRMGNYAVTGYELPHSDDHTQGKGVTSPQEHSARS
jgi:hypothetical protein